MLPVPELHVEIKNLLTLTEVSQVGLLVTDQSLRALYANEVFIKDIEQISPTQIKDQLCLEKRVEELFLGEFQKMKDIIEYNDLLIHKIIFPNHPDKIFFTMQKANAQKVLMDGLLKINDARLTDLGQMASGIAHEINNPLTVVLSKLYLMEKVIDAGTVTESMDRMKDSVVKARNSIYKITKIIKGLKNLARTPNENEDLENVSLNDVIIEVIELCAERFKENGVILKVENSPTPHMVRGRSYQISQILLNLLNNAYDAVAEIPVKRITLQLLSEKSYCVIRVFDNGPGVSNEIENKIMNPFFTTKKVGQGTGLGLSISKKIAQNHHGDLALNRSVSNSCFELKIPRKETRSTQVA